LTVAVADEVPGHARTIFGTPGPLDTLSLAPHPDDAEIGTGGTLARLARSGRAVGILELTWGERGRSARPTCARRNAWRPPTSWGSRGAAGWVCPTVN
jgi:hypothetical protein